MAFRINKIKKNNYKLYQKDAVDIARSFTTKIYKKLGDIIKIVVLFGSSAKQSATTEINDIDILIVVDDTTIEWTLELVEAYRLVIERNITEVAPERLHITTLKLTTFWDYLRNGDPIAVNILRDGMSLIDNNIFDPIQSLLFKGRIKPSIESIHIYYSRAPQTLMNAKWHLLEATKDLYWAVIDASHAALMTQSVIPPSPKHVSEMINKVLVDKKLINKKHGDTANFFYDIVKKIEKHQILEISGSDYDKYHKRAEDYVMAMDQFIASQIQK